jgi:hypothetical protein
MRGLIRIMEIQEHRCISINDWTAHQEQMFRITPGIETRGDKRRDEKREKMVSRITLR